MTHTNYCLPSLARRLAALLYDSILILAILMFITALSLAANQGENVAQLLVFKLSLLIVICGFYVGFWHFKGQTLGMAAWRLKIIDRNTQKNISLSQAFIRFCLGFSFNIVSLLWPAQANAPHERFSASRLILLPKPA